MSPLGMKAVEGLQKDMAKKGAGSVKEVQSLVSYCLQILAKVQADKKRDSDTSSLLLQWRNQSWTSARRRVGMESLKRFLKCRIKDSFGRWRHQSMYETTVRRITTQFMERIPDVARSLDELGTNQYFSIKVLRV